MADARALADFARLVADLTHDLRVPLGSIVGAASTLSDYADKISADKRSTLCSAIIERGQYLEHLLTSLAAIAKARTGALDGEADKVELNEHLLGLASRVSDRAGDRIRIRPYNESIFANCAASTLTTLVFAMLDLAAFHAEEDSDIELGLSSEAGAPVLWVHAITSEDNGARIPALLERLSRSPDERTPATAEAVLVSAVLEIVAVLGGSFDARVDNPEGRQRLAVRLPAGG